MWNLHGEKHFIGYQDIMTQMPEHWFFFMA